MEWDVFGGVKIVIPNQNEGVRLWDLIFSTEMK